MSAFEADRFNRSRTSPRGFTRSSTASILAGRVGETVQFHTFTAQRFYELQSQRLHGENLIVPDAVNSAAAAPKAAALRISQFLSAPNQLTLARMAFLPFIVNKLLDHHFRGALILFLIAGLSDGLDGLLARRLHQQTLLGQYLDPIADKMLLSTVFLVLSVVGKIPWKFTVLVFSRDVCILLVSGVLYTIAGLRDFRPSIFGKLNTLAQVAAVVFVMFLEVHPAAWVRFTRRFFLSATFALTILSGLHYVYLVGRRLHHMESSRTA
jgi:cardiolipin synthase (CMP-forming)